MTTSKNQNKFHFFQIKISGVIVFPKTMLNNSPIWCTECTEDICPNHMTGEFVKKNNVKRQQEYANLIFFQIKLKDGN